MQNAQRGVSRGETRVTGFSDREMDFQLLRSLGNGAYGASSPGECLALVRSIRADDPASWAAAFAGLAERLLADGETRLARGHTVSARDQFQRAAEYFRAAEYYADPLDASRAALGERCLRAFAAWLSLAGQTAMPGFSAERLLIPYEGGDIPAYLLAPARRPSGSLLVAMSGFDGTGEELFSCLGLPGVERGHRVLLFDGPGQAGYRRLHPSGVFRPDWERVIGPVLDHALRLPGVDSERLALAGISLGGYFATRAAAFDPRVRALVANSPIVDLFQYLVSFLGGEEAALRMPSFTIAEIVSAPPEELPPRQRGEALGALTRFGCESTGEWLKRLRDFTITGEMLSAVRCPSLGILGEAEGEVPRTQYETFLGGVSGKATGRIFTAQEGADAHCQVGNQRLLAAEVFDWLEDVWAMHQT